MILDEYCIPCGRKLKVERVGLTVLELTERGEPYKLLTGDLMKCPECEHEVVSQFGEVFSQQGEDDFDEQVKRWRKMGVLEVT